MTVTKNQGFGPNVLQFLEQEEKKDILQEYQSTTKNLGYKKVRPRFKDDNDFQPITTIPWSLYNMSEFNFVQLLKDAGLATEDDRLIRTESPTPLMKKIILIMFNNMDSVRIMMKTKIKPKSYMQYDGTYYVFTAADLKPFVEYHFPNDLDIIKKVNASDVMKSMMIGFERNPIRGGRQVNLLKMGAMPGGKSTKIRKVYHLDSMITLFTMDQLKQIIGMSRQKPHYTMTEYIKLIDSLVKSEEPQSEEPDIVKELMSEPEESVVSLDHDFDDSVMPAIEISEEETIQADSLLNISTVERLMSRLKPGEKVKFTIEFSKSSGE